MTFKEQVVDCFNNCREFNDGYVIEVSNKHSIFVLVEENPDYDDGTLEYFIELNNTTDGSFEPCSHYNESCPIDDFNVFYKTIINYIGCNKICI